MKITIILILAFCLSSQLLAQNDINAFLNADSILSADKREEAEEYLIQLINKNPYNGNFFYDLGQIYFDKGEYKKSISQYRKAQKLGMQDRSNYYMACSYMHINMPDSALFYLKKHVVTPLNGPPLEGVVNDSIFNSLRSLPEYQSLLIPAINDTLNVIDNWITDISYLSKMLKKTHFNPFLKLSECEWDKTINELKQDVPSLNNDQILVQIYQFLARMGDAHTLVVDWMSKNKRFPVKKLPINTSMFSDGCYITSTTNNYSELLGTQILKVNDIDFDSIYNSICTLIPTDNKMWYNPMFNSHFRNINLLHGLGISNSTDSLEIVYSKDDEVKRITLKSVNEVSNTEMIEYHTTTNTAPPLFLKYKKLYWFEYLKEENILYVQINAIASLPDNPLEQFCDSIKTIVDSNNISAFVLDIRNNTGGNSELNKIIIKLLFSEKINKKGTLFTVIGNRTFSAAQNLTSDIENYTETIFIGEPTGSRPNFIGEINPFKLPFSGLVISSSNLYHQHGPYSADTRTWIAPDIYIARSFNDYKNGIDPVLDEIIEFVN